MKLERPFRRKGVADKNKNGRDGDGLEKLCPLALSLCLEFLRDQVSHSPLSINKTFTN